MHTTLLSRSCFFFGQWNIFSLIRNNRGFAGQKFDPVPVSENEVRYTHLPEVKVEFYTLFQSQRSKKHILLGDTDL